MKEHEERYWNTMQEINEDYFYSYDGSHVFDYIEELRDEIERLRKENDRLQKIHEAELGVCEQYCDVVSDLKEEIGNLKRMNARFRKDGKELAEQNIRFLDELMSYRADKRMKQIRERIGRLQKISSGK